ncbi:hypothetical protein Aca07nite_20270 [Actinoplanes capillaceus]|uniref:PQQ-like domain-containing protein n=1 Tax=Actinoplanes campanulatus TaxID=113559 RepID=A0ABQ3WCM0_9ACTN|nr:PQQ-binding-like beta-propeller repeat protein [Actinoplanes capillaceus]GID44752.1 hypothetical protein Aca07nite_20270 [Actinoplanes capillaceus]
MIIDLDVPGPPPDPVRRPRPWRPASALVLALTLLLGPDHLERPVPPLERVATTETATGSWLLTDDTVYSTRTLANGKVDVLAHDLTTNRLRWRRQTEWFGAMPALSVSGSAVVVGGNLGGAPVVADTRTGADAATGLQAALPAGDAVVLWDEESRLGLRDPVTNEVAWRRPFYQAPESAAADGRYLVVLEETGGAVTLRRSDGRVAGRNDQASPSGEPSEIRIVGDHAYLLGEYALTALHLPDLTEMWTVRSVIPKFVDPCGTHICVSGGGGLHALNPEDGSVTWTDVHWKSWTDGFALSIDGEATLLDPETGATRTGLGPGLPLGDLLLRPTGDGLRLIDWHTGQTRGAISGTLSTACRRTGVHLACQQSDGLIQVWRLP